MNTENNVIKCVPKWLVIVAQKSVLLLSNNVKQIKIEEKELHLLNHFKRASVFLSAFHER